MIVYFGIALAIYIVFRIYEVYRREQEDDLLNSLSLIDDALEKGDSIETAIVEVSKGKDKSARLFRKIVAYRRDGHSLTETFDYFEKKVQSTVFSFFSTMVKSYDKSEADISPNLKSMIKTLTKLKELEDELNIKTRTPVMILQVIGIIGIPSLIIFVSTLLEVPLFEHSYTYMLFIAIIYSILNFFVYTEVRRTILIVPVFILGYLIAITTIGPYLGNII